MAASYHIAKPENLEAVRCPCGWAKRAFLDDPDGVASFHVVRIEKDSRTHYHKKMTEIYFVLEGEGVIELDGETHPLTPGTAIMIKPGCRHRARGELTLINVPVPQFDEDDEWFDE